MARFDVYHSAKRHPRVAYFLDVQAEQLSGLLRTRIVVPLIKASTSLPSAPRLHLTFEIEGQTYAAIIPELGGVPVAMLGAYVMSCADRHYDIVNALDFVFQGY